MAITRIAFNDTATYSGAYSVPLNPSRLELNYDDAYTTVDTLDGSKVKQSVYFDSRPYKMYWTNIRDNYTNFGTMIGTLKGYVDSQKYVNFGTADYRISPPATWLLVRVTDIAVSIPRGGQIKYNVEITLLPENS